MVMHSYCTGVKNEIVSAKGVARKDVGDTEIRMAGFRKRIGEPELVVLTEVVALEVRCES